MTDLGRLGAEGGEDNRPTDNVTNMIGDVGRPVEEAEAGRAQATPNQSPRVRRLACLVLVVVAAVVAAHVTGHLSWFWTGDPGQIIGGNGLQLGDLHLFVH